MELFLQPSDMALMREARSKPKWALRTALLEQRCIGTGCTPLTRKQQTTALPAQTFGLRCCACACPCSFCAVLEHSTRASAVV